MSDHKPVSPLFRTKPMAQILEEAKTHEGGLKRVLTAFDLTAIGVGAIIGAGIFVLTGTAAADHAGPGVMLSYFFAGLSCIIAALCYAEFASRLPISGSAYTYSYASVGELFAWIIGWDLVLEYTIGSSTVAVGWTKYLVAFLTAFGVTLPDGLHHMTVGGMEINLLAGIISVCMRATSQIGELTGAPTEEERRLVAARAHLGDHAAREPAGVAQHLDGDGVDVGPGQRVDARRVRRACGRCVVRAVSRRRRRAGRPRRRGPGRCSRGR